MSKNKFTPEEKIMIVKEYLAGGTSYIKIGRKYKVDESSIRKWVNKYQAFGERVFEMNCANLNYSAKFKKRVVAAYLNGEGSYKDIAIRFKIHAASTVLQWVKQYNNHMELTDSKPKGVVDMVNNKGRKTTYEERIAIVEYCIEHHNNYAETALKYEVSYQQVYSWIKKYQEKGIEALQDRRGKAKSEADMSDLEKLQLENRMLRAENRKIELENELLKKLEEIERRRY
jgi:Transposase and inactivated derivatives